MAKQIIKQEENKEEKQEMDLTMKFRVGFTTMSGNKEYRDFWCDTFKNARDIAMKIIKDNQ